MKCELRWWRSLTCLAALLLLTCSAQSGQNAPASNADKPQSDQQQRTEKLASVQAEREKQIVDDSAKLLKLATELNTEASSITIDTLSLKVVRKADEIEKLAHSVREEMKLTVAHK